MQELYTRQLILREWREADRQPFAEMSADAEVMRYLMPHATRADSDAWIDRQRQHQAARGFCFWAVELAASAEFVGSVGLYRVPYQAHFTPAVEVGWRLARRYWGQGYATEAAEAALQYGFEALRLPEIVANTAVANASSQRVMQRLGMSRDPADDFDHPRVPEAHPLRRQVLYRLPADRWRGLQAGSVRERPAAGAGKATDRPETGAGGSAP
jgi:RimJ/RimL family protein N-acetyltransferase